MTLLIWARFRGKNLRSRILTPFHVSFKNFRQGPADENLLTAAAKSAFKLVKLPNLRRHSSAKSWIFYRRLFCGVGWVGEGGGGGWHFCAPTMQTSLDQLDMFSNLTSLFFAVSINIPLKINCRGVYSYIQSNIRTYLLPRTSSANLARFLRPFLLSNHVKPGSR